MDGVPQWGPGRSSGKGSGDEVAGALLGPLRYLLTIVVTMSPEAEAVCRHCLQIFTEETTAI